jgi:hypothetical protein
VIAARALAALLVWGALAHAQTTQQPTVRLVDPGPRTAPRILAQALAAPHTVVPPGQGQAVLPRDSTYRTTVIVVGRDAVVDGTVHGDVMVVDGELHVHPHAMITGRAIAFGGGVYTSAMADVGKGSRAYRDFTYEIEAVRAGYELRYVSLVDRPEQIVAWPGLFGLRVPEYDRSNGLSTPFGPSIALQQAGLRVEPRVTYRSQLGRVDPRLGVAWAYDRRTTVRVTGERSTFTNEGWIWHPLLNSLSSFTSGDDARNYYRGTRAEATISHGWEWTTSTLAPYVGLRWERDRSVRPDSFANGGPWSIGGKHSRDDMLRPNPPIDSGTIVSGLVGLKFDQDAGGVSSRLDLGVEAGELSPKFGIVDGGRRSFAQATLDGTVEFPTFGTQSLRFEGHAVATAGGEVTTLGVATPTGVVVIRLNNTPRQRWAYVGGWGSIPTIGMLSRGGDQLIYLDGGYNIPIDRIQFPLIGPPVVTLRGTLGGADVGRFPSLAQAVGVRGSISAFYAEFLVDPANHHGFFGVGLSLQR